MDDDEVDNADAVVVINSDSDDTPAVETGDTTVIVAPDAPTNETGIDPLTERLVKLEMRLDAVESTQFGLVTWQEARSLAEDAAAEAVEVALDSDEAMAEQIDDAIVDTIEDTDIVEDEDGDDVLEVDNEPESAKIHILFRPGKDLFRRD